MIHYWQQLTDAFCVRVRRYGEILVMAIAGYTELVCEQYQGATLGWDSRETVQYAMNPKHGTHSGRA